MGVNMSGSGALEEVDLDFEDAVGWLAEAGVLLEMNALGVDITLRYTGIDYTVAGLPETLDASSLGVFVAIHYALVTTKISRTD